MQNGCETRRVSTIRGSGYVYLGKLKRLLSHPASGAGCETSGDGGTSLGQNSGCGISREDETSQGWSSVCAWCRDPSRETPSGFPKRIHAARSPIRTPLGRSTRHLRSSHPDDSISYPDVLSGWLTKVHKPCYDIPTACPYFLHSSFAYDKGLQSFGSSCLWAFHYFAMDSKELSSISDCFGDQKAIKRPKLNTIWLELIAKVLNMLIGLKGNNYYSKVFKRVNYKLQNSTFWVVIMYNVRDMSWMLKSMLIHQRDIKRIFKYIFVTSCLVFRGLIPTPK